MCWEFVGSLAEKSASEPVKLASKVFSYGQKARRVEGAKRYVDAPQQYIFTYSENLFRKNGNS
jgi:hypothetical protein